MAALVLPVLLVYLLQRRIFNALPLIGRSLPEPASLSLCTFPFQGNQPLPDTNFPDSVRQWRPKRDFYECSDGKYTSFYGQHFYNDFETLSLAES